jgi:hypothetical protein
MATGNCRSSNWIFATISELVRIDQQSLFPTSPNKIKYFWYPKQIIATIGKGTEDSTEKPAS